MDFGECEHAMWQILREKQLSCVGIESPPLYSTSFQNSLNLRV